MVQQVHTTKGGNMRRMKKAIAMGLATMMTISLAACGNTSGETTQETELGVSPDLSWTKQ